MPAPAGGEMVAGSRRELPCRELSPDGGQALRKAAHPVRPALRRRPSLRRLTYAPRCERPRSRARAAPARARPAPPRAGRADLLRRAAAARSRRPRRPDGRPSAERAAGATGQRDRPVHDGRDDDHPTGRDGRGVRDAPPRRLAARRRSSPSPPASRGSSASSARSSPRTTSAPAARSTRSRSRSRSRTSCARSSPTRRSRRRSCRSSASCSRRASRSAPGASPRALFWLMLLGLTALTALFIVVAPWVIGLFGDPGRDKALAVGLSRVLFPIVALLGVSGIVVGILNSYEQFTVPALSPVFWNLAIIVGLVIGVPQAQHDRREALRLRGLDPDRDGHPGAAADAVAARARRPAAPRDRLARPGREAVLRDHAPGHARPRADQLQRGRRHVLRVAADRPEAGADRDREGVPRLHAPAGDVLGRDRDGALPVAVALASAARETGDYSSFRGTVSTGLRQIAFLLVPASVVSAVLAEPIVRLVYQRGHFDAEPDAGRRGGARRVLRWVSSSTARC